MKITNHAIKWSFTAGGLSLICLLVNCKSNTFKIARAPGPYAPFPSNVAGNLYIPDHVNTQRPAIVMLHATNGLKSYYETEAQYYREQGYVVLVMDYYRQARPGGMTGEERGRRWQIWEQSVLSALTYLVKLPQVDQNRISIMGMSQGASLAMSVSGKLPSYLNLQAIINYYGPSPDHFYISNYRSHGQTSLNELMDDMPPMLILQGELDALVSVGHSKKLHQALIDAGKISELHTYPWRMHSFIDERNPFVYDSEATQDSRERVINFLNKHTNK